MRAPAREAPRNQTGSLVHADALTLNSMPLFEILDLQDTPLGQLCLRRRELLSRPGTIVTEVTLDHVFLMSSYHTESERALTDIGLQLHQSDGLDVMVGGLGLGFTAQAALASHRVTHVEVVELLEPVMSWLEKGWLPDSDLLTSDDRFQLTQGDVYARLLGEPAVVLGERRVAAVPGGEQPLDHRIPAAMGAVDGQQLLQLVEQQPHDAGLRRVQPGDQLPAAGGAERPHDSLW